MSSNRRILTPFLFVTYTLGFLLEDRLLTHREWANHLQVRQSEPEFEEPTLDPSIVPPKCQEPCVPFVNSHNVCESSGSTTGERLPCFCTIEHGSLVQGCLNCLIEVYPSQSQIDSAQSILDGYNTMCADFDIPTYTLSYIPTRPSKPPASFASTPSTPSIPTPSNSPPLSLPSPPSSDSKNPFTNEGDSRSVVPLGTVFGIVALAIFL